MVEVPFVRPDGARWRARLTTSRLDWEHAADLPRGLGQPRLLVCLEDATELHEHRVRLEQAEADLEGIIAAVPDAILVLDRDRVVYANRAAAKLFGLVDPAELRDRALPELVHEADLEEVQVALAAGHTPEPYTWRFTVPELGVAVRSCRVVRVGFQGRSCRMIVVWSPS